jgi:hypothetical protein
MTSNGLMIEAGKVEAYPVSERARMGTLPRHFGRYMTIVEGRIFDLMGEYCADYKGGYWQFFELSNGGFYMAPKLDRVQLHVPSNGYRGEMSADAAGVMACLFAFSLLSSEYPQVAVFGRHFYRLRDYALGHVESTQIFKAID